MAGFGTSDVNSFIVEQIFKVNVSKVRNVAEENRCAYLVPPVFCIDGIHTA
jgi:hypothetical protein